MYKLAFPNWAKALKAAKLEGVIAILLPHVPGKAK